MRFKTILLTLAIWSAGCLEPRPPQPPPPPPPTPDIHVRLRPVVLTRGGVPCMELQEVPGLFATCDRDFRVSAIDFRLLPAQTWERPDVHDNLTEELLPALSSKSREYAQRGEHAVFILKRILDGQAIGIAYLPPQYGIAVVPHAGPPIVVHELGHSFGLVHKEPVRDCVQWSCSAMGYCRASIPPCERIFDDDEVRLKRQWLAVEPRRSVAEHDGVTKIPPTARIKGTGEIIICNP